MFSTTSPTFTAVEIEINGSCNQKCSYCPNATYSRAEKGEMSLALFVKVMKELEMINFKGRISYDFYNEPMISFNFFKFIELTRNHLPQSSIELYTNGSLLTLDYFLKLESYNITYYIITKHEKVIELPIEKYLNQLTGEQKSKIVLRSHDELIKTNRGGSVPSIGPREIPKLLPCHIPSHIITITCEGNVLPCFEDFYEQNVMGNIHYNSLMEIWNSPKYLNFRKNLSLALRHKYKPCDQCNRHQICKPIADWKKYVLHQS